MKAGLSVDANVVHILLNWWLAISLAPSNKRGSTDRPCTFAARMVNQEKRTIVLTAVFLGDDLEEFGTPHWTIDRSTAVSQRTRWDGARGCRMVNGPRRFTAKWRAEDLQRCEARHAWTNTSGC